MGEEKPEPANATTIVTIRPTTAIPPPRTIRTLPEILCFSRNMDPPNITSRPPSPTRNARGGVLSNIAHGATIALAVALVVAIVVFILCIIYFEELIVVFTAIAGGLLVDYGLTLFGFGVVAVIAAIAVVVIGIIFQLMLLERFRGPVEPETKNVTYTHTDTTSSSSTDTPVTHRDN